MTCLYCSELDVEGTYAIFQMDNGSLMDGSTVIFETEGVMVTRVVEVDEDFQIPARITPLLRLGSTLKSNVELVYTSLEMV